MDILVEQFIKERKYFRNLAEKTLILQSRVVYCFAKANKFENYLLIRCRMPQPTY